MMQGLHHHQQQLAALLTAALPKDDSSKAAAASSSSSSAASVSPPSEEDESSRLAAITTLHRTILYPPNSLLVTHSASFLAQGFSQLLTDKTKQFDRELARDLKEMTTRASKIFNLERRDKPQMEGRTILYLAVLVDRFIGWSLPSLRNISNETSEIALESLREFLNVGEVGAVERYALPILKACQELLEDERTSMSLLPSLLGVLTLISLKFFRCFQPHFMDIVDLLLGWALVPDIVESDKHVIMDSFLQFQKHWVNNMQFSLGLLSKFLGDMDVLLQDGSPGTPQQFKRLLALLSCFCTVLQSVASGLLEINFLEQIREPLSQMVPVLLGCLSMVGKKFGWSKWIEDSWRCLTLLAEILSERFSTFYPIALDILFASLEPELANQVVGTQKISSFQVYGVLKTNLQLLSLQKLGLMPSSVNKTLQFDGPISRLRLHPNHLVTGSVAATYIFLLQHGKNDVVEKTMGSLFEELQLLKRKLEEISSKGDVLEMAVASNSYSKSELVVLIKFNWEVLLSCVALREGGSSIGRAETDALCLSRAQKLAAFLIDKFDPFNLPIASSVDLQVTLLRTLERLAAVEFISKCSTRKQNSGMSSPETSSAKYMEVENVRDLLYPAMVFGHLRRYTELLTKALDVSSPLAVKIEALKWIHKICENVIDVYRNIKNPLYPCQAVACWKIIQDLLFSTATAASDREPEVRSLVATVLEMLLKAKIIHPMHFPILAEIILEKLVNTCWPRFPALANRSSLHWKQVFALKQLPQQLHSQQLVSILSYISQRWKVPLSSWIQRLIYTCRSKKHHPLTPPEEAESFDANGLWLDIRVEEDILERICLVNRLAGAWWAVHEAARFCITTRLRTNLGGPTQTFAALERMLLDISHVLQLETEQNDGSLNIIGSTILPHASRTSSLFFRANKKVCEEWFSRISEPMMDAGVALQCHDATIHYCNIFSPWARGVLRIFYSELANEGQWTLAWDLALAHDSIKRWCQTEFSAWEMDSWKRAAKGQKNAAGEKNTLPNSHVTLELCKNLVILARKQRNLMLAARLNNCLKGHATLCSDESFRDYFVSSLEYQDILLMRVENKLEDAYKNLWSFLYSVMVSFETAACNPHENVLKAKACLKLSNWLQGDGLGNNLEGIVLEMKADFNKSRTPSPGCDDNQRSKSEVSLIVEELVGTSRKMSTLLCPMMGKSWILYASWCYTQARASLSSKSEAVLRFCSFSPILATEIQPERITRGDYNNLITECTHKENDLKSLLHQIVNCIETAAGAPGLEDCSSNNLSAALSSQLQQCLVSANITLAETKVVSLVTDLIDVWWSLRRRRVSLFGHAAQAFISYLSCSSLKSFDGQLTGGGVDLKYKNVSYTLRSTLYVLHILVNYGVELKDILEPALSKVPLLPWQEITPQLFARLSSHPDKVVRKQLETLLIMLAKHSPWSLVYPTLVDANSPEKEPSEELQNILSFLNKLYPRLVQDAQLMIKELENVTVLWEELWLGTLQDLHADVMRRINLLKEEAARIAENSTLTHGEKNKINAAKYSAMMAPIVVVLERRLTSTSRRPETPHELWFLEEYQEQIRSAVTKFKTPPASVAALGDVWRPFETIATSLASYQRKSSISFGEVAPQLALLSSSNAPMPGLEKQIMISESESDLDNSHREIVTVASFSEQLFILPTKTKPKKLVIVGSDGLKYTYLLKGREDLRLDARIMQLLQSVNGFLQSSSATRRQSLDIRYYSVTPISGRAGLIQWVDNVISIYSVFKSWQKRAQLQQLAALGADTNSAVPPVPRPSDMFYGKIIPALKEKGIRRVISRRDWPHDVKQKVLLDLINETPKQLIHQELWCASEGFKAFSSKLNRFSGSVAAMSIVGHILGLGDRHLDNILIDFSTGDIVHIDYNVCFDKGQRLKIPEIVPFRLTQTIEAALGLTGIEGSFRANCEAVLGVLRKNKDIILMLLEVFVWDPLVEWTRANFHDDAAVVGEERKGMELAVSLSLFASRVQEIRVPLQEHHDLLLSTLPAIESALERFASILNQYEIVSSHFYRADQERSNLVQHETSAKSVVAEATCISEKSRALFEIQVREFSQAQAMVLEKGREAATWIEQQGRILDALRSSSIPEIKACIKLTGSEEALSLTSAVIVAGVPLTVVPEPTQIQCHDIDREVSTIAAELDHGLSSAVAALQMYSLALQRILPLNYVTTSPVHGWAQVLLSLSNLSSDIISVARRQGAELVSNGQIDRLGSAKSSYDDLCLKVTKYASDIERLEGECRELVISIGPETESKSKERLLSAFINYMQYAGLKRKEDSIVSEPAKHEGTISTTFCWETEERKTSFLNILGTAVSNLFSDVKHRIQKSMDHVGVEKATNSSLQGDLGSSLCEFEEQIEKCLLVTDFLDELKHHADLDICDTETDANSSSYTSQSSWPSLFKSSILLCKNLIGHLTEVVVPSVIKSIISFNSDVMDVFGSISQIRGSVDTALDQLIEVELERVSLIELESNYFVKVGLITERQLALEEAAVKGRDHLSWEEAEELASQEEACRVQLDKLHQTWNQKDLRTSSLIKKEANINNALAAYELQLRSLITAEPEKEPHVSRRKVLLAALVEPFSELESVDKALMSLVGPISCSSSGTPYLVDSINSGCSISEYLWKLPGLLHTRAFFIWKVSMVDLLLESCMHDVAASFDQNLGFDLLVDVVKKKIRSQFQEHIRKYLKDRVGSFYLTRLDTEIKTVRQRAESSKNLATDHIQMDVGAVRRVQLMLEEYCNAHETFRAARTAASVMKRQVNELKDALLQTSLEIAQMEWMYNISSRPLENIWLICQKFLANNDDLLLVVLNANRPKLLESIRSSVANIARLLECLKSFEGASTTAEGQLERAMSWACGGPNSGSVGNVQARNSGIPPEFHNHLIKRRKLLQEARENASDIMKICLSILEFEASRDGIFRTTGEISPLRTGADGGMWQQSYLSAITKLDVTYHSFTRAEKEWKLAQSNMEAASSGLVCATNELSIASVKAKSASGDLQSTLLAMRDSAYEASVALSSYRGVVRGHSALTSECGSMLEEVLAITEGLHDVHILGKEAAVLHSSLMGDLSKANALLIPLESLLSKDVAAMTDAMAREKETKLEIAPIHGQAIFQSYHNRVNEALQVLKPLVPSLTLSVKGLYSVLTRLARAASLHAGNLHKALEGVGESLQVKSQDIDTMRADLTGPDAEYETQESEMLVKSDGENDGNSVGLSELALPESGWVSPPVSISSGSAESGATSAEASIADSFNGLDTTLPVPGGASSQEKGDCPHFCSSSVTEASSIGVTNSKNKQESSDVHVVCKDDEPVLNLDKAEETLQKTSFTSKETVNQAHIGKNAYAMSVLRRVEMKLDGRDMSDNRLDALDLILGALFFYANKLFMLSALRGNVSIRNKLLKNHPLAEERLLFGDSNFSGLCLLQTSTMKYAAFGAKLVEVTRDSDVLMINEDILIAYPTRLMVVVHTSFKLAITFTTWAKTMELTVESGRPVAVGQSKFRVCL
ncbi:Serine/threonine-protein kinase SMG1 [Sesamum angolense]|uniref:non-specific serine/threonine protein kinase n=1 Tax=Sesamum angolense TaxID=2727404 RepID=A0AAE1WYG7_9LAMI|nr:Serine/threonine-protein kinase SMG1 [Sesamum angolense]